MIGSAGLMFVGLGAAAPADASTPSAVSYTQACAAASQASEAACDALQVQNVVEPVNATGVTKNATPAGYGPSDLLSAYNLPANGGAGQTVAIVDAYNDPNAASDMAVYRSQYGLPACTAASGCFRQVNETGGSSLPADNPGWADEISLDLDMVSAIAPNAHIILVEATSNYFHDLAPAESEAVALGARFVSNSWGGTQASLDTNWDSYFNHPGVAITVSAGDSDYGVEWPAASPYVTAVGGTTLSYSTANGWKEVVWSGSDDKFGTGSGCSAYEPKPSWQTDTGCSMRTVADISAVADPRTGVAVYDTGRGGWTVFGGTSVGAPLIAAIYADAGTPTVSYPVTDIYSHTSSLRDVTKGSNGTCSPDYLCKAEVGYDGPTGWGTPDGLAAFTG